MQQKSTTRKKSKPKAPGKKSLSLADTVIVLDFETTGLSPNLGERAIEVGAIRMEDGKIIERFQKLMNPGRRINSFIEEYTGITNKMLKSAPPCAEVMHELAEFIGSSNIVAHNASFDKGFLDAELSRIKKEFCGDFVCSMLLSRRIYQDAPNHKLETLVRHAKIKVDGNFHRALYDAEMTAKVWLAMLNIITIQYNINPIPFPLTKKLASASKKNVVKIISSYNPECNTTRV